MLAVSGIGFRGRLVGAMVGLVAVVSLSIGGLFMVYLFEDEQARAVEQLELGERIAREVFERRTNLTLSRLDVASRDFGFRSALASGNRATADSALANQSGRVGADFSLIVDADGQILASADGPPENLHALTRRLNLLNDAREDGFGRRLTVIGKTPVELVVLPVRAAGLRAQLIAGFQLGAGMVNVIERLSGTELLFRARPGGTDDFQILSSYEGMGEQSMGNLETQIANLAPDSNFLESANYFTRIIELADSTRDQLQVLLLIDRQETLKSYFGRAIEIALLVIAVLVMSALIALFIARGLGRPVLDLAGYAKAIGDGESPEAPSIRTGGELRMLRQALQEMLEKLKNREQQIRYAASHDEITGLPNSNAFLDSVRDRFAAGKRCRLFGFRLAELSNINDTLGLAFGDQVLQAIARRLKGALPVSSELARTGGREFLVLTDDCGEDDLETLGRRLQAAVEQPLEINSTPFALRCLVIGMRLPDDADSVDQVRRRLNLTFELAQDQPQKITYYQPGRDEDHLRELQIIADLGEAIANRSLTMNYQPKLSMASGKTGQVEALVRWIHPELGFISPEEFIFLAEQSGQINELTGHILSRVAEDARNWHADGLEIGVAINLSALDLSRPELAGEVADNFVDWPQPMSHITLEVTESALMDEPEVALNTLKSLRDLGVTLSVDDFGTGYSSLSQLRKLPVQELKIDKSFVLRLDQEPQDQLIVKSTIDMAHGLELRVVAEGVENLDSWHLLKKWGCETGQGFYMSRPVPASDLPATLEKLDQLRPELTASEDTV